MITNGRDATVFSKHEKLKKKEILKGQLSRESTTSVN